MADTKALPVFAFTEDRVQAQQLRAYLKEHGATIEEDGNCFRFSFCLQEMRLILLF